MAWFGRPARQWAVAFTLVLALVACSQPAPSTPRANPPGGTASNSASPASSSPHGSLKIAWAREPETLNPKFLPGGGAGDYTWLFSSALAVRDLTLTPHPMLARELPTQANGDWVINPDGTMITTYRLRENALWHDGAPIVAHDYVFAYEVYTDDAMPVGVRSPESIISRVEAPDDHTVVITWKELYPQANVLGYRQMHPMPSHLLEEKYRTSHATFATGDEWSYNFVGSGPFKVERWDPGSRLIARAHTGFFLGPPKIDTIEIRFISDPNTVMANLLSGEVDMTNSPTTGAPESALARDQWVSRGEGYIAPWFSRLSYVDFQFREVANWQRAIGDVRVRQALMLAIDRQGLTDVINLGLAPTADIYVAPSDPVFPDVDRAITKYPYDPGRALALLAEAGWRRSGEGGPLTNAANQPLDVQIWSDLENDASIVSDSWKAIGISSTPIRVPAARRNDQEYRNSFPAAQMGMNTINQEDLHTISAKLPKEELGWLGSNRGSFSDSEVDRLHHLVITTLDAGERRQATVALHQRLTELVAFGPLMYSYESIIASKRVKGPTGSAGPQSGVTWNVYEWEVTD